MVSVVVEVAMALVGTILVMVQHGPCCFGPVVVTQLVSDTRTAATIPIYRVVVLGLEHSSWSVLHPTLAVVLPLGVVVVRVGTKVWESSTTDVYVVVVVVDLVTM